MTLNVKQTQAIDILENTITKELIFGGGAGSSKSFLGCYWLLKMCLKYPGSRWLMGRKKLKTLKETTLNSFLEVCKIQNIKIDKHFKINHQSSTIIFVNGSEILMKDLAYYPSDPNYDELGSLEISGAFIDECNQIPELAWQITKSRIRYKLDEFKLIPKILGTCNPSKNWVYKKFYKADKDKTIEPHQTFIQALVTDNPDISQHYIDNLMSLPKPQKERLLFGNWESDDDPAKLIEYDEILNIFSNDNSTAEDKHYITCDVARMGSDKAVIIVWKGFVMLEIIEYDQSKIDELHNRILKLKSKYNVGLSNIIADEDGVGGGLVDMLKCKGFINNSKALNDENYQNLKSQCYFKLAEAIMNNEIGCRAKITTKQEEDIIEELEQVKSADIDTDGKLKIVSKNDVKMLIGRSPDYSDAMMMRMWWKLKPTISKYRIR